MKKFWELVRLGIITPGNFQAFFNNHLSGYTRVEKRPLVEQMEEFWKRVSCRMFTNVSFQAYLNNPDGEFRGVLEKLLSDLDFDIIVSDRNVNSFNFPVSAWPDLNEELVIVDMGSIVVRDGAGGYVISQEVRDYMEKRKLVPAEIEYCALYASQQSIQELEEHPVVCLGSVWMASSGCFVPVFSQFAGRPVVHLLKYLRWSEKYCLPARRKRK